jgi:hypothetical protein
MGVCCSIRDFDMSASNFALTGKCIETFQVLKVALESKKLEENSF